MEPPPNYPSYTRDQLADALAHINRERYPANYLALMREIERRKEQGDSTELESEKPPLPPAGIYGIVATLSTVGTAAFGLWVGFWGLACVGFGILDFVGVIGSQVDPLFSCIVGGVLLLIAMPCWIPLLFHSVRPKK